MRANRPHSVACEQHAKFIDERIAKVEKHFADMCTSFGGYTRKTASLRDKTDEIANVLHNYAESENVNKSLKSGLYQVASSLSILGDYRHAEVRRMETKIVTELSQYDGICRNAREEVRHTVSARDRELARKRHLDRIKERSPRNKKQISLAESEFMKASADSTRTGKVLEELIDVFEKKKLHDIRTMLLDFVTIELSYHAKAIEMFTKAYQDVTDIDEEADLEEFRNTLRVPDSASRLETVKRTSFRNNSFSLSNLFTTPSTLKRSESSPGIAQQDFSPQKPLRTTLTESVDSMKTGLESSIASVHIEEYVDGEDDLSSYASDDGKPRRALIVTKNFK